MKKTLLFSALLAFNVISYSLFSIDYVSAGVGPSAWNDPNSWIPNGVPTSISNVTIDATHTINITAAGPTCKNLTVNGTINWSIITTLNVRGNYSLLTGGSETGVAGRLQLSGTASNVYTCTGTSAPNVAVYFYRSYTIAAGSDINKVNSTTFFINSGTVVTNLGTYRIGICDARSGTSWINGANSDLFIHKAGFFLNRTFNASASGNTVNLLYTTGNVPVTSSGYYDLNIGTSGTKSLTANLTVSNDLAINTPSTLNSNNFDIAVGGDWSKTGTFTASAGKVVSFNGAAAQTISGSATTAFSGLTIDNAAGVSLLSGSYTLSEVLTLNDGTFDTGGNTFTMLSTATQTARIAPISATGAIAGNFTIQRFITARDTTWADFSSPVQNSTFADWEAELIYVNYTDTPPYSYASAYTYDEAADEYVPVTSSGTALNPGQGFEVYLSSATYANFPATTMTTVGVPNQGDFNLSSSISQVSQGWNLVGNPFASNISWASVYAASGGAASGLYDFVEMYDYTIGDWSGYTSADAIEIGSTQGFWVYPDFTAGSLTLLIPESSKTTTSNSSIKSNNRIQPYFTLKLGYADGSVPNSHTFKVAASGFASDGFDNGDLPFRKSPDKATPELYSVVDGKNININTFNSGNDSYSMPLKTQANVSGNYRITASGFEFMSDYTCIKLQDSQTGQTIDLNEGNGYCFTMNVNDSPDRFILHFSKDGNCKSALANSAAPSVDFENHIQVLPTSQGNMINFSLSESANTSITVSNMLGQNIVEKMNIVALDQSVNITLPEGYTGMYIIKVESDKGAVTKKFVKK